MPNMRCLICKICQDPEKQHVKAGVNRILLKLNREKFSYPNPITGDTPRGHVAPEEWTECLNEIKQYLLDFDIWVSIVDLHNHATRCNVYSRVFISPEIPPVLMQTRAAVPWSSGAIIYF